MLVSSIAFCEFPPFSKLLSNDAMEIKDIRRHNLLVLRARYKTFKALAEAIGTDPAVLSQINTGYREMGHDIARRIEVALELPVGWMDTPKIAESPGEYNVRAIAPPTTYQWPLVSWVSAGLRSEAVEPYENGTAPTMEFEAEPAPDDLALQVKGDSMVRPDGSGFPDGCFIAIRANRRPKNQDFVVVRFANSDEATFKQYVVDGPVRLLKPLNDKYATYPLAPDAIIVGTVCEKRSIEKF